MVAAKGSKPVTRRASILAPDPAQAVRKPRGESLHVGVNELDQDHYGTSGLLRSCELDAHDYSVIAASQGFARKVLLTENATARNVLAQMLLAADSLIAGDIFFMTFSGHGGQVPDFNGDEPDRMDETWCCYDRQLVDDELFEAFTHFRDGVRVIVLSDSCHSGTVTRTFSDGIPLNTRCLPPSIARATFARNSQLYQRVQATTHPRTEANVRASVILISACQDHELAIDGPKNGAFTAALKSIWNDGKFRGRYSSLCSEAGKNLASQRPNYLLVGETNEEFETQKPFTI